MTDRVVVGKFGRPHGVTGEVRFWLYNPDSDLVEPGVKLRTDKAVLEVASARPGDRFLILTLEGVQGREAAAALTNAEVWIPRDELPEPDPDEFYLVDIIGFDVEGCTVEGAEPSIVGKVDGFLDSSTVDIMIVTGPRLKKRLLIPMIDVALETIDHEAHIVRLAPFDRWFPEDEAIFAEPEPS